MRGLAKRRSTRYRERVPLYFHHPNLVRLEWDRSGRRPTMCSRAGRYCHPECRYLAESSAGKYQQQGNRRRRVDYHRFGRDRQVRLAAGDFRRFSAVVERTMSQDHLTIPRPSLWKGFHCHRHRRYYRVKDTHFLLVREPVALHPEDHHCRVTAEKSFHRHCRCCPRPNQSCRGQG